MLKDQFEQLLADVAAVDDFDDWRPRAPISDWSTDQRVLAFELLRAVSALEHQNEAYLLRGLLSRYELRPVPKPPSR